MVREAELRRLIAEVFRWTYIKGLNPVIGGNISARLDDETILITPSGMPKHLVRPANIVKMKLDGTVIGPGKPSSEWRMHVEIYKVRDDVRAIIHAHPPAILTLSLSGLKVDSSLVEVQVYVGDVIPEVPTYAPGSQELAEAVSRVFRARNVKVVILRNHGVVAVGSNIFEAFNRVEVLEQAAWITIMSHILKSV